MSRALVFASILGVSGLSLAAAPSARAPALGPTAPVEVDRQPPERAPRAAYREAEPEGIALEELAPLTGATREPSPRELERGERIKGLPPGCSGRLLREWLSLQCSGNLALVAGSAEGVRVSGDGLATGFTLVVPLRPGDRRTFEVRDRTFAPSGYGGKFGPDAVASLFVLSEIWLEGDAAPTLVLTFS